MAVQCKSAQIDFLTKLTKEQVWELVSDTNRISELVFHDKPSELVRRDAKSAILKHSSIGEFEELPWAFEVPSHFKSTRLFTHKTLKKVEQQCRLTEENSGTRVFLEISVETVNGVAGTMLLKYVAKQMEKGLGKLQEVIVALASTPVFVPELPMRNADLKKLTQRCQARLVNLPKLSDTERDVINRIIRHIASGSSDEVARMRPYELARRWALKDRRMVLACFLHACHVGLVRLSWDLLCPSCAGGSLTIKSLKDLPPTGHCASCDISFDVDFAEVVEATFIPEPQLRKVSRTLYCLGSPKRTQHWIAQLHVSARDQHALILNLSVGRYKLQTPAMKQALLVDVEEDAQHSSTNVRLAKEGAFVAITAEHEEDVYDNLEGATTSSKHPHRVVLAPGKITIHIQNTDSEDRRVQLVWRSLAHLAATAADVTTLGLYRDYFSHEVLSSDQQVQVGQVTLLFTDIVGSLGLYVEHGSAPACALVRRHCATLTAIIEQHSGNVIKTMGDRVMAAFEQPELAARAAIACVQAVRKMTYASPTGEKTLQLRAGVHLGPCLAISGGSSGSIDYFGSTVNTAARACESFANAGEVVLTHFVTRTTSVKQLLKDLGRKHAITNDVVVVKGLRNPLPISRIAVAQ